MRVIWATCWSTSPICLWEALKVTSGAVLRARASLQPLPSALSEWVVGIVESRGKRPGGE